MLRLVTPPTTPVVSLEEIKRHVRVYHDDDDTYLSSLVDAATGLIDGADGWLGRSLVEQTWELSLDRFPYAGTEVVRERGRDVFRVSRIYLPLTPLISVLSIEYTAVDGTTAQLTTFRMFGAGQSQPAYIVPASNAAWPSTKWSEPEAVRIRFVAGYGAASVVPKGIKHAIMLMVGHWYENREDVGDSALKVIPMTSEALLMPYRNWRG